MITHGTIALFCDMEYNPEVFGNRVRYGGGFIWERADAHIRIKAFWKTADTLPDRFRLHLFGTTPEKTIGCIVIEDVSSCEVLQGAPVRELQRTPIDINYETVLEYSVDVEKVDDDVIDIEQFL